MGDFNGDGLVDLLTITTPTTNEQCASVWVHWTRLDGGVLEATGEEILADVKACEEFSILQVVSLSSIPVLLAFS